MSSTDKQIITMDFIFNSLDTRNKYSLHKKIREYKQLDFESKDIHINLTFTESCITESEEYSVQTEDFWEQVENRYYDMVDILQDILDVAEEYIPSLTEHYIECSIQVFGVFDKYKDEYISRPELSYVPHFGYNLSDVNKLNFIIKNDYVPILCSPCSYHIEAKNCLVFDFASPDILPLNKDAYTLSSLSTLHQYNTPNSKPCRIEPYKPITHRAYNRVLMDYPRQEDSISYSIKTDEKTIILLYTLDSVKIYNTPTECYTDNTSMFTTTVVTKILNYASVINANASTVANYDDSKSTLSIKSSCLDDFKYDLIKYINDCGMKSYIMSIYTGKDLAFNLQMLACIRYVRTILAPRFSRSDIVKFILTSFYGKNVPISLYSGVDIIFNTVEEIYIDTTFTNISSSVPHYSTIVSNFSLYCKKLNITFINCNITVNLKRVNLYLGPNAKLFLNLINSNINFIVEETTLKCYRDLPDYMGTFLLNDTDGIIMDTLSEVLKKLILAGQYLELNLFPYVTHYQGINSTIEIQYLCTNTITYIPVDTIQDQTSNQILKDQYSYLILTQKNFPSHLLYSQSTNQLSIGLISIYNEIQNCLTEQLITQLPTDSTQSSNSTESTNHAQSSVPTDFTQSTKTTSLLVNPFK